MINIVDFLALDEEHVGSVRKFKLIMKLDTIGGVNIPSIGNAVVIKTQSYLVESVIWNYDAGKIGVYLSPIDIS